MDTGRGKPQSPREQFRISITFNVLSAIAAISMAIALLVTHWNLDHVNPVIWAAVSLFFVIGGWQIASFFNNLQLQKRFIRGERIGKGEKTRPTGKLVSSKAPGLKLPEADPVHSVPVSVVEETTRELKER